MCVCGGGGEVEPGAEQNKQNEWYDFALSLADTHGCFPLRGSAISFLCIIISYSGGQLLILGVNLKKGLCCFHKYEVDPL